MPPTTRHRKKQPAQRNGKKTVGRVEKGEIAPHRGKDQVTRDFLINLFTEHPDEKFKFSEIVKMCGINQKSVSALLSELRDMPNYGIIHQPERGFWQFRDRRSQPNGNGGAVSEFFNNPYAFQHMSSIRERIADHSEIFSEFDLKGFDDLINKIFNPQLSEQFKTAPRPKPSGK